MAISVKFINPFITAACKVLKEEIEAEITRGEVSLEKSGTTSKEVTVALGVTGDVRGGVFYGFSEQTARSLVSEMLGEPVPIFDELAESGIGEMGNVITGLATAELEQKGLLCRIAPPTVVTGKGVYISTLDFHRLIMPLETQYGAIEVNVALKPMNREAKTSRN